MTRTIKIIAAAALVSVASFGTAQASIDPTVEPVEIDFAPSIVTSQETTVAAVSAEDLMKKFKARDGDLNSQHLLQIRRQTAQATYDELYDEIDRRDGGVNSQGLLEIRRKLNNQQVASVDAEELMNKFEARDGDLNSQHLLEIRRCSA